METLLATLVFVPLSILIVEASFSAPIYPATSPGKVEGLSKRNPAYEGQHQQKSLQNEDVSSLYRNSNPLRDHANLQYFTYINIGNPPQPFRAAVDISWSDIYVFSSKCEAKACLGHYQYNSSCSTTYSPNGTETQFRYGGFGGTGFISQDTFYVAGIDVREQQFQELDSVWQRQFPLMTSDYDAVLGLAPSHDFSPEGVTNLLENMVAQGVLDKNIISIGLGGTILDKSYPGEITYGGINEDQYHGDLRYIPLSNVTDPEGLYDPCEGCPPLLNGTWRVEANAMSWSHSPNEHQSLAGFTARFDTAEPYIYLPRDIWERINVIIDPVHIPWFVETIDCERRDLMPDLTFQLGDHNFTITAYEYMPEVLMGDYGWRCMNGIQPWDKQAQAEKDMILLGSPFLRGFYSVFDFDKKQLGLGYAKHRARKH